MKQVQVQATVLLPVEYVITINDGVPAASAATDAVWEKYPDAVDIEVHAVNVLKHSGRLGRGDTMCDDPLYCPICKVHFPKEVQGFPDSDDDTTVSFNEIESVSNPEGS